MVLYGGGGGNYGKNVLGKFNGWRWGDSEGPLRSSRFHFAGVLFSYFDKLLLILVEGIGQVWVAVVL